MTRFRLGALWCALTVGALVGLAIAIFGSVRVGGCVLAASVAVAGMTRICLPEKAVGALAIRSRWLDGVLYLGLAAAIAVVVLIVKLAPID